MKKLITILLLFLAIASYGQTKLDLEIFNVINQYRVSHGLHKLEWRQDAFEVVKKHNDYMLKSGSYSHGEPIDIPNHKELSTPGKRFADANVWWYSVGENIASVSYSDSTLPFIAKSILSTWISSPGHKRLLLHETMEFGAVSISLVATKKRPYSDITGYASCTFSAFR